jgi:pimeloyl-ACP methyl ester carboxylesterase
MTMVDWRLGSVVSADGTVIGYRQTGAGRALVLLHGAFQSSHSFTELGAALAASFTVTIPDRRGRGASGPFGARHGLGTEVEDLAALLEETGAHDVFGLSAGAVVALEGALVLPAIHRLALFEPPLLIDGLPASTGWVLRYERALAAGRLGMAMAMAMKGTGDRELMTALPGFVLAAMFGLALRFEREPAEGEAPSVRSLIPTVHYDIGLIAETAGRLGAYRGLKTDTLLLGGTRSVSYLPPALDALERTLPHCRRVELAGVGHLAAANDGAPDRVASELRRFFAGYQRV